MNKLVKTRTRHPIWIFIIGFVFIIVGGWQISTVRSQPAPTPTPYPTAPLTHVTRYGMQFIDHGRTLRLALENPESLPGEIVPCIRVQIILNYYETLGDGSVRLSFVRQIAREIELEAGEAAAYDFPAARGGSFISATVLATPEDVNPPEPVRERVTSTVTVRELGRSILTLPAVRRGFDPQPDPPAAY